MVDIAQPVTNTFIFTSIAITLGVTALGIAAVYMKKRQIEKRKNRDNA